MIKTFTVLGYTKKAMKDEALQAAVEFLDSWLRYRSKQVDIPGFSVAICYGNVVVFSRAYGVADVERGTVLTPEHMFGVASQTKMFTATAILQLVERGALGLDEHACTHLPWLAEHHDKRFQELTIRQLLSHSAGLVRDGFDANFWELQQPFPDKRKLRELVLSADFALEPNTELKYSNLGYTLLGQIVEAVSGQSYQAFINQQIITPLELTQTFSDYSPRLASRVATAYGLPHEHHRVALTPRLPTKALAPAVGIHTTLADMCRFAAAHCFGNEVLLSDQSKKEAQRSQWVVTRGYDSGMEFGLGFEIQMIGERRVAGHSGHLAGHQTATYFDPRSHIAVAVMANAKDAPIVSMTRGVFETLDWFAGNAPVPKNLARFNVRLQSATAAIEIVANKRQVVAIDPNDWEPFTWHEELERIDTHSLRVITPGSIFNYGERLRYTFSKDAVRAVNYAGYTLLPEITHRTAATTEVAGEQRFSLEDLQHARLRIGRVLEVKRHRRGSLAVYRLIIDFGAELGVRESYVRALPPRVTPATLRGRVVLGTLYPIWDFDQGSTDILMLGIAANQTIPLLAPGASITLALDPFRPQVLPSDAMLKLLYQTVYGSTRRCQSYFLFRPLTYSEDDAEWTPSFTAWRQGKYRKSLAMLDRAARSKTPIWFTFARQARGSGVRIRVVDTDFTPYESWEIESFKRIHIPLFDEKVYLLPRKYIADLTVPAGDFSIYNNTHVLLNSRDQRHNSWTHSTFYNAQQGHNITSFFTIKHQLLQRALTHGQKL